MTLIFVICEQFLVAHKRLSLMSCNFQLLEYWLTKLICDLEKGESNSGVTHQSADGYNCKVS